MTDGLTHKVRGFSTVYKAISYQLHESWGIKFLSTYIYLVCNYIKRTLKFRNSDIRSRIMENIEVIVYVFVALNFSFTKRIDVY